MRIQLFFLSTLVLLAHSENNLRKLINGRRLGYSTITSSTCTLQGMSIFTSASACANAAKYYGLPDTDTYTHDSSSLPPGCYLWESSAGTYHLTFNRRLSSTQPCESSRMCLCNNKKVEFPSYSKRKSGNCIGVSIRQIENTITTPGACKIAAKALMVGWTDTSVQEYDTTSYPPGCYLYKYETFFSTTYHLTFNKKLSSTAVYSSTREGVCDVQCGPGTYQNDNSQTEWFVHSSSPSFHFLLFF
jgi:hypothetical protein